MRTQLKAYTSVDWSWAAGLALFTIFLYLNTLPGQFFMDDLIVVHSNPLVQQIDLVKIFTTDYWQAKPFNTGLFRPLTILSFGLNQLLTGPDPWGFHLVNVLFFGLVSAAAYLLLRRLRQGRPVAIATVALFAAHPLHVEVVNQLVGRSELLAAFFLLTGLILARGQGRFSPWLVPVCFLMALFSKEHAIVFPALLFCIDLFFCQSHKSLWRERRRLYLLLALTAAGWLLWRSYGIDHGGLLPVPASPVYEPHAFVPGGVRLLTALAEQGWYLKKLLVPLGLQGVYSGPNGFVPVTSLWSLTGAGIIVMLLILLVGAVFAWRRKNILWLPLVIYVISFLPTSNLLFVSSLVADRLAFFPSLWFCWGLVLFLAIVLRWRYLGPLLILAVTVLAVMTPLRNQVYRDPVALWRQTLTQDPENPLARFFLAGALERAGSVEESFVEYRRLIKQNPEFLDPQHSFAAELVRHGHFYEGAKVAELALQKTPGDYQPTRLALATSYQSLGQPQRALDELRKLAPAMQAFGNYWDVKARSLEALGDINGAINSYFKIHDLPRDSDSFARLGKLLLQLRRLDEAESALRLDAETRDIASSWNALGVVLALAQKPDKAAVAFERAVKKEPDNRHFRDNLERARNELSIGR